MKQLALLLTALLLSWSAAAQETEILIKFSHVAAEDTPKGKGALKFKELAERYTDQRVRVEVYPNSTLYKDQEELDALLLGAVQMLAPSLAKFGPLGIRQFELFDLPYLFDDYDALRRVTEGAVGKKLLEALESKGLKGLAYWDNGFKVFSANKPLRHPEDFRGVRMRIQPSKVLEAQMHALGAIPKVIAFSEVYPALQKGVVDGAENPPSNLYTQKMHEVQKYITLSNHGYLGYAVITNKRFWEALPAEIRSALERALAEATAYTNRIAKEENEKALEAIRRAGVSTIIELSPEEKARLQKALLPVHQEMSARIGKEVLEAVYQATGFARMR